MYFRKAPICAVLALGLALVPACVVSGGGGGPMQEKTETVPLECIQSAEISLNISAGETIVRGADSADLLAGVFRYNRVRLEPDINVVRGLDGKARVTVRHRRHGGTTFGHVRNTWDLTLSNRVPLDLDLDCGAGESNLDLRGLDLRSLTIDMGVGSLKADLTGERTRDLKVTVDGGVGEATFELPATVGVRAEIDGGLGSVHAPGFTKSGRVYTNEAWGKAAASITVSVDAGIGSVNLKLH
jgi:hypothetical protein